MDCIISLPVWDILGWWLLDFCVFDGIEVTSDLEINSLHMGVNHLH